LIDQRSALVKASRLGLALAVVRDLREQRAPAGLQGLAEFETDVLAGFVLARASARDDRRHGSRRCRAPGTGAHLVRQTVVGGWNPVIRVVECPIDETNRPCGFKDTVSLIPPSGTGINGIRQGPAVDL
jgi:hypothetical protein